jgi:hypothetical protein
MCIDVKNPQAEPGDFNFTIMGGDTPHYPCFDRHINIQKKNPPVNLYVKDTLLSEFEPFCRLVQICRC